MLEPATEEQANILLSSMEVGKTKSVGYLPLYTIRDFLRRDARALARQAADRGLSAMILNADECCIKSGALYFYDASMLSELPAKNFPIVRDAGCPTTPARFVRLVASTWFDANRPIVAEIKTAFGDA